MSEAIIKVENISKSYLLKHKQAEKYTALRDIIANKAKSIFTFGNKVTNGKSKEEFWALKNVSFEVKQGDRVGIIGRNGAGKSTLLKVLSRIVTPTSGRITIDGRVASLLEVGTGFHPELSGRENIFLNGSILGMSKIEIQNKFDEIVAFAEVEKFLDTPVKRYSSGMYVRLAFAVAAHLEPEILIVDEVLAVGDAEFQKKCLGKMKDVSAEGRTVLFVSHNMEAIQKLCNKGLLLNNGNLTDSGNIDFIAKRYLEIFQNSQAIFKIPLPENFQNYYGFAIQLQIEDVDGKIVSEVALGSPWSVRISFHINKFTPNFVIALGLSTILDMPLQTTWSKPQDVSSGDYEVIFSNTDLIYKDGQYKFIIGLSTNNSVIQYIEGAGIITISDITTTIDNPNIVNTKSGLLINQMLTKINKLNVF